MNRIASIAAAAFAATGIALAPTPAAADNNDLARIIAGIAVAGIIAKAVDDRKDRKRAQVASSQYSRFGSLDEGGRRVIDGTIRPYRRNDYGHGPKVGRGYNQQALPERCLLTVETERGSRLAYSALCLDRTYKFASKLPSSCETVVRTPRGYRDVFGAQCLARDGWRVAGR